MTVDVCPLTGDTPGPLSSACPDCDGEGEILFAGANEPYPCGTCRISGRIRFDPAMFDPDALVGRKFAELEELFGAATKTARPDGTGFDRVFGSGKGRARLRTVVAYGEVLDAAVVHPEAG